MISLLQLNRLIFENRYLSRELQSLKAGGAIGNGGRLETLNFKKTNITRQYYFNGSQDEEGNEIPKCVVNEHVELFDQNCSRRNESVVSTLRRFVKYLLENVSIFRAQAAERLLFLSDYSKTSAYSLHRSRARRLRSSHRTSSASYSHHQR